MRAGRLALAALAAVGAGGLVVAASGSTSRIDGPATASALASVVFTGVPASVITVNDVGAIDAEVVFEDSYGSGMAFPHVYGPIPTDAVRGVVDFPPGPDGRFRLPPELST